MSTSENTTRDEGLIGNEKMEEAIAAAAGTGEETAGACADGGSMRMREKGR